MTLRHMKIFLAVCTNSCNTTKAAESLNMTQPAVSLAIKELERYYGVVLFERLGRRLSITHTGRSFAEYARRICSLFDDMEKNMRAADFSGLLRVGASLTIGERFLPGYVKRFNEKMPDVEVRAVIAPSEQLEKKLLLNEIDFALIEGIPHEPCIAAEEYMTDRLTVICPKNCPFINGQTISTEVFRAQKILLREKGSGTREVFDRETEKNGFSVTPQWESLSSEALINAVANGIGVAVLPERLVKKHIERGEVIAVGIDRLNFGRSFQIVYHRDKFLTPAIKIFFSLCKNTVG